MQNISPLAWLGIALIIILTVAVNLGMIALLRRQRQDLNSLKIRKSRPSQTGQSMQKFIQVLRDPFGEERKQLGELSELVNRLHDTEGSAQPGEKNQEVGRPKES